MEKKNKKKMYAFLARYTPWWEHYLKYICTEVSLYNPV
jgi:hypothetical protein